MSEYSATPKVSKHPLSTANMSTCCYILEVLAERGSMGIDPLKPREDVLADYNEKRVSQKGRTCGQAQLDSHINFLRTFGFVGDNELTAIGKRAASHCADGSHDLFVSITFYREIYRRISTFQDLVIKIREGHYSSLVEIIDDLALKHGFNESLKGKLKTWINELDLTTTEGNTVRINRFFEAKALEQFSVPELLDFLGSLKHEGDSLQEEKLYRDLDRKFFCGTEPVETMKKIINKLATDNYVTINRGKFKVNFILLNPSVPVENLPLHKYLAQETS